MTSARVLLLGLLAACGPKIPTSSTQPEEDPARARDMVTLEEMATAGVTDDRLAALLLDHWQATLTASPSWASSLGLHSFDGDVDDNSLQAIEARQAEARSFLERAQALEGTLSDPADARFLSLFIGQQQAAVDSQVCQFHLWSLNPRSNVVSGLFSDADTLDVSTPEGSRRYLDKLAAWPATVDQRLANLQRGRDKGLVANATSIQSIIQQMDGILEQSDDAWTVHLQLTGRNAEHTKALMAEQANLLSLQVRPAVQRYRNALADDFLLVARSDDQPGLAHLDLPEACYDARVRNFTTIDRPAKEVHEIGLKQMEKIHAEFRALGPQTVGSDDLATIFQHLREAPELRFQTAEEIVATAESALRRAEAKAPEFFGVLPETPCVVTEIPAHEAPYTTIAYYRQPAADGSKPGEYFVNTYAPTTRPRHEAEVLAYHESVPGHHFQIARSYELPETPAFHRFGGATAFVEGWALYTERLAEEMGLYSDDWSRMGMLSFDAWRAGRLVVDTGIHAMGWSRDEAITYLLENTPLATNNISNEIDRYIAWPGQAVAYKTGQLEILRMRREAEETLGDRFDLSAWHDTLLGEGALSLPVLEEHMKAWVEAQR